MIINMGYYIQNTYRILKLGRDGHLMVDRERLHSGEGYKCQVRALGVLKNIQRHSSGTINPNAINRQ